MNVQILPRTFQHRSTHQVNVTWRRSANHFCHAGVDIEDVAIDYLFNTQLQISWWKSRWSSVTTTRKSWLRCYVKTSISFTGVIGKVTGLTLSVDTPHMLVFCRSKTTSCVIKCSEVAAILQTGSRSTMGVNLYNKTKQIPSLMQCLQSQGVKEQIDRVQGSSCVKRVRNRT